MAVYLTHTEFSSLWKPSLEKMIRDCKTQKKIPQPLVKLVKHNLYAKYVNYDPATAEIEIGVNESSKPAETYATIQVYSFPLDELENKLVATCRSERGDIEFYAKTLTGRDSKEPIVIL